MKTKPDAWGAVFRDEAGTNLARFHHWWTIAGDKLIVRKLSNYRRRIVGTKELPITNIASVEITRGGGEYTLRIEVRGGSREKIWVIAVDDEISQMDEFHAELKQAIEANS